MAPSLPPDEHPLRELLTTLAEALVEQPGRVRVRERRRGDISVLELEVPPGERGRVIGRHGRTAHALRTVLAAAAERRGAQCEMEILD
jgi:predicted RNA-binding protein YlqC (UPF0109 family)